jgi:hypothetical protein
MTFVVSLTLKYYNIFVIDVGRYLLLVFQFVVTKMLPVLNISASN